MAKGITEKRSIDVGIKEIVDLIKTMSNFEKLYMRASYYTLEDTVKSMRNNSTKEAKKEFNLPINLIKKATTTKTKTNGKTRMATISANYRFTQLYRFMRPRYSEGAMPKNIKGPKVDIKGIAKPVEHSFFAEGVYGPAIFVRKPEGGLRSLRTTVTSNVFKNEDFEKNFVLPLIPYCSNRFIHHFNYLLRRSER